MFTFEGYIVLAVIAMIILSLYYEWKGTGFIFMVGISILGVFKILTPKEMLAGFANEQIAVIILLLILGDIIRKNGIIDNFFYGTFMNTKSYKWFLGRMMVMVAGFSAFLNNTPLVAIMIPYVNAWGERNKISPSKLLIPLSYATILGGCATLIGTSTNLVVNGMVTDRGLEPLKIFDFSLVGIIMILVGFLYLLFFSGKLLPNRVAALNDLEKQSREYIVEARISNQSKSIGKTIENAGLRNLNSLFLVEIIRDNKSIHAVSSQTVLKEDDILLFAGDTTSITELINSREGLVVTELSKFSELSKTEVIEIIVSHNSNLISKTAKEINFRGVYDASIIAIHRNGERVSGKLGDVRLRAGDVLLVLAGEDFNQRNNSTQDFYVISKVRELKKIPLYKNILLIGGIIFTLVLSALGITKLFTALLILLIIIVFTGTVSPKEISRSIDYNLIIVIALSLALGTAMINSGVAEVIAHNIINLLKPLGIIGLFSGIFLLTNVLASFITNKASVAIIFPIALSLAIEMGIEPKPFILLVAFAGAASFMTPIGYQTNLMVYGPGGYKFKDFFKIGLPLTILYMLATVFVLVFQYNLL